jgi:hypothetical protein
VPPRHGKLRNSNAEASANRGEIRFARSCTSLDGARNRRIADVPAKPFKGLPVFLVVDPDQVLHHRLPEILYANTVLLIYTGFGQIASARGSFVADVAPTG